MVTMIAQVRGLWNRRMGVMHQIDVEGKGLGFDEVRVGAEWA
jgi:hypothetical protein